MSRSPAFSAPILASSMKSNLSVVWFHFRKIFGFGLALEKIETVIGVELVEKAVLDFSGNSKIIPEIQKNSPFNAYSHQGLKILQGNFFDLNLEVEDSFQAVFDNASLVAIPEELRPDYVQGLTDLMVQAPGCFWSVLIMILQKCQAALQRQPKWSGKSFFKKEHWKCLKPEITWKTGCVREVGLA